MPILACGLASILALSGCDLLFGGGLADNTPRDSQGTQCMDGYDTMPTISSPYEALSRSALAELQQVYAKEEYTATDMQTMADDVAQLFAYACYGEQYLDHYSYMQAKDGKTTVGAGSATAQTQDYFIALPYLPTGDNAGRGIRYHYTIKKVTSVTGALKSFKGLMENNICLRFVKDDLLYRFEGTKTTVTDQTLVDIFLMGANWNRYPEGNSRYNDWGKVDGSPRVPTEAPLTIDEIKADIVANAGSDNMRLRGNVNLLANNVIERVNSVYVDEQTGAISISLALDIDVANRDQASKKMVKNANGSDCSWDNALTMSMTFWPNGLMQNYYVAETWVGKIYGMSGSIETITNVVFDYAIADYHMDDKLAWLNVKIQEEIDKTLPPEAPEQKEENEG